MQSFSRGAVRPMTALSCLAAALFAGAGCGSKIEGKSCDTVLDCPTGYGCIDGHCTLVDITGRPDAATNIDGAMSMADAGALRDGDVGLEGDAGYGAIGCSLPPYIGAINPVEEFSFPNPPCIGPCGNPGCAPLANDPFPNHYQIGRAHV